jgi:hypothetical protein
VIALPVATGWLGDSDCRKQLIAAISGVGVGIALVPGGSGDPLEGRKVVAGLVELLESAPGRVAVLRTDLAGIGALAFGAAATSIGLSAALRHAVAASRRAFAQQDRSPRVLVGPLLSWVRGSQLAQVVRDKGLLSCRCAICHDRSLRRFLRDDPDAVREAATHSVLVWRSLVDRILGEPQHGDGQPGWRSAGRRPPTMQC